MNKYHIRSISDYLKSPEKRKRPIRILSGIAIAAPALAISFYLSDLRSGAYEKFGDRSAVTNALEEDGFNTDPGEFQWRYDRVVTRKGNVDRNTSDIRIRLGSCAIPVTATFETSGTDENPVIEFTDYRYLNLENDASIIFSNADDLEEQLGDKPCISILTNKQPAEEYPED